MGVAKMSVKMPFSGVYPIEFLIFTHYNRRNTFPERKGARTNL